MIKVSLNFVWINLQRKADLEGGMNVFIVVSIEKRIACSFHDNSIDQWFSQIQIQ